ncbi:MAG: hypothetical protein DI569_07760 [Sphingopyxis macrogoltabida]|uniref:HTH luxR-type domain-containing protein n=1 Tax=Sphingopyxis macrogoltabida TaxID=33050 RepID=A0A2W5L064_SPHMC|nr:MAG: hypothetical protein DI569_07760 [Sphingopyxis macrogoltabida]
MTSKNAKPAIHALRMTQAGDSEVALRAVRDIGDAMGIPTVTVIDDLSSLSSLIGYRRDKPIFESNLPAKFRVTWNRRQYRLNNPVYLACRTESVPFIWRVDAEGWSIPVVIDAAQRRILNFAASFGMTGGICVPIHAPRGHIGCISFIGSAEHDLERILEEWRSTLIVAGVYFMRAHAQPFRQDALDGMRHLTKQEVACVTFAARGMTDKQIAIELDVVPGTARFHIENAARKLSARSRTQTVAIAAQLGLIGSVA